MIPGFACWECIKAGFREDILELMKVSWDRVAEQFGLGVPMEGFC